MVRESLHLQEQPMDHVQSTPYKWLSMVVLPAEDPLHPMTSTFLI